MTKNEKQEIVYLAMEDIYKEFNNSVNNLVILREFLHDVMRAKEGNEMIYEYPSIHKAKSKKSK